MNPKAKTFLLLKDIFPQNAVDIGMMTKSGAKGILYKMFRKKEIALYKLSDYIGCMSPANVEYLLAHNTFIERSRVCVAPNSYKFTRFMAMYESEKKQIREKYGIPTDKIVFLYGGNLGKPQGIPFLIDCLKAISNDKQLAEKAYFLIIGKGTERQKLVTWYNEAKPKNVSVMDFIPKEDYDMLARSCDVGLIFLDFRFTIPNYPSRLLPYLKEKKPIIAATDPNTDVGKIAAENGYGFACMSNDVNTFMGCVHRFVENPEMIQTMGEKGYEFFINNYTVDNTYSAIMNYV